MLFEVFRLVLEHHLHGTLIFNGVDPEKTADDLSGIPGDNARHFVEPSPHRGRVYLLPLERRIAPALKPTAMLPTGFLHSEDFITETEEMIAHRVSAFMDADSPDVAFEFSPLSWRWIHSVTPCKE